MIEIVLLFLALSIILYLIMGGADFGAGILECFLNKPQYSKERATIDQAIAPVWEANHMWLILTVVILFNGFPEAYAKLSVMYHIPLTLMLVGIILRGSSFSFRHYDPFRNENSPFFSRFFQFSSLITPFMMGTIAGSLMNWKPGPQGSFLDFYVYPWINGFALSVGLFLITLCAFTASIYLIGEAPDQKTRKTFVRFAKISNVLAIQAGLLVFFMSYWYDFDLLADFFKSPSQLGCVILASALLPAMWFFISKNQTWVYRIIAAIQNALIVVGWLGLHFPHIVLNPDLNLHFYNTAAPAVTLKYLLYALSFGMVCILPAFVYLLKIFKGTTPPVTIKLTLYSKKECELCEPFSQTIQKVLTQSPWNKRVLFSQVDIESDAEIMKEYKEKIPACTINGRLAFKYKINSKTLIQKLKTISQFENH